MCEVLDSVCIRIEYALEENEKRARTKKLGLELTIWDDLNRENDPDLGRAFYCDTLLTRLGSPG